jgi:hypothetical protein
MKLRYCVNLENCFREGIDCVSRVQVLEVDPKEIPSDLRAAIADRLKAGQHHDQEVMDVCWIDVEEADVEEGMLCLPLGDRGSWDPDFGHLLIASLPGLPSLIKAIEEEEKALNEHVRDNNLRFSKRIVDKGVL